MRYLLDTNICIYIIKQKPVSVREKFQELSIGEVGVSTITVAELEYGVQKSHWPERNQRALHQFLLPLEIAPFNAQSATIYGSIRASLEAKGRLIGSLDMLIAAHALQLDVTLVTNNEREFKRIPQLAIENWL